MKRWTGASAAVSALASAVANGGSCPYYETPPPPPDRGAVLWVPPAYVGDPNTLVLGFNERFVDTDNCFLPQNDPWVILVDSGGALVFYGMDGSTGKLNAWTAPWGAVNVPTPGKGPIAIKNSGDYVQTSSVAVVDPAALLASSGSCPQCELSNASVVLPNWRDMDGLAQDPGGQVTGAKLLNTTLVGNGGGFNFSGSDLSGSTLTGDMSDSSFAGVKANGTRFVSVDLQHAAFDALVFQIPPSFTNAKLGGDYRQCTSIANTNLAGASFQGMLWVPGCQGALFPGSQVPLSLVGQLLLADEALDINWTRAQTVASGADRKALAGASLSGLNLSGIQFLGERLDLTGTQLDGATLTQADLTLARLVGTTLTNVSAAGASFEDADLSANDTLPGANFSGSKTSLQAANFVNADVSGASFVGADLTGAVFTGARSVGTDFSGVRAHNAVFSGAHVYGDGQAFDQATDLSNIDFSGAVLAGDATENGGFDFADAELTGAHFDGTVCVACNFTGAHLQQASFTGAYLPGATLSNATVAGASLDRAWLYCGSMGNDWCDKVAGDQPTWAWPLALGTDEAYGPVPFTATNLTGVSLSDVTACPDGKSGSTPPAGCQGHLLPRAGEAPPIPAACSASAHGACPTPTITIFDATTIGDPWAVVPTAPPTWNTTLSGRGYYVGFNDGTVRRIGDGPPTLIAGSPGKPCPATTAPCGDGGPAAAALLGTPKGLAVGLDGSLYIADPLLFRIRRIDPSGTITTVAGTGVACTNTAAGTCGDGGPATAATLAAANGVWIDPRGVLLMADGFRGVRRVAADGTLTTLAAAAPGTLPSFQAVVGDADGTVYASTNSPDHLLQIDPSSGDTTPVVGTGTSGYNGTSDSDGSFLPGTQVQVNQPVGLSVDLDDNILFADSGNALIRAFVPSTGHVIDLAGSVVNGLPQSGFNGDGQWANDTLLSQPWTVSATRGALFVVADSGNQRVRQLGPNPVTTVGDGRRPEVVLSCRPRSIWSCRRLPVTPGTAATKPTGAATIRHEGTVFANGRRITRMHGRVLFLFTEQRPLVPGWYELTLRRQSGSRQLAIRVR